MYDRDSDNNMMDNFDNNEQSFDFSSEDFESVAGLNIPSENIIYEEGAPNPDQPEYGPAPQQVAKPKSSKLFPLSILLLGLVFAGAMLYIYADSIPFVSDVVQKIKGDAPEKIKESDVQNVETVVDADADTNNELENILKNAEGTGISVENADGNPSLPTAPNSKNPNMAGAPSGGNPEYPPLPNAQKNSQPDLDMPVHKATGPIGRLDPFNPSGNSDNLYEVVMPPNNPTVDIDAAALLSLKISGIMYTPESPSAIINISGEDQLVRKGDKFYSYKVIGITKDKVTVQSGKNTYSASVGETLDLYDVGVNAVPNLNKKFAGPYSKGSDVIIEINTLN